MSNGLGLGLGIGLNHSRPLPIRPNLLTWIDTSELARMYSDAAIQFNAPDKSWLQILDAAQTGLDPLTDDFWFAGWYKHDTLPALSTLFRKLGGTVGYTLYSTSTGALTLYFGDGSGALVSASSAAGVIVTGTWQFIVANFDRDGNAVVYVNGTAVLTLDISSRAGSVNATAPFNVGAVSDGSGTNYFDGSADSLCFGKGALLDATARARLYNGGLGLISSDITLTEKLAWGGVSWWDMSENCYSADTEILTENGFKLFKDMVPGEKVATLDADGFLEYQTPIKHIKQQYTGQMFHQRGKSIDLMVTPHHDMLVRNADHKAKVAEDTETLNGFKWVMAKDLNRHVHYKRNAQWKGVEQETFTIPGLRVEHPISSRMRKARQSNALALNARRWGGEYSAENRVTAPEEPAETYATTWEPRDIPMDAWLRFFGIWLAEGFAQKERKSKFRVGVCQSREANPAKCVIIEDWLRDAGFSASWDGHSLVFSDRQVWSYLRQFGYCEEKFIPKEIKALSSRQLKLLLEAMIAGDGWSKGDGCFGYGTASKRLADDVAEIALKCGYSVTVHTKQPTHEKKMWHDGHVATTGNHTFYTLHLTPYSHVVEVNAHVDGREWVDYDGYVYCVVVPNRTLYVRRNGRSCWSGNSGRRFDSWGSNHLDQAFAAIVAPAVYGSELVSTNPGFESDLTDWSSVLTDGAIAITTTAGEFYAGTKAVKVTNGVLGSTKLWRAFALTSGLSYRLTYRTRGDGTNAGMHGIYRADGTTAVVSYTSNTVNGTEFRLVVVDFVAPATENIGIFLRPANGVNGGIAYFDDVSLKQIVTPAINNGGFDGWTVPAATNLVTNGQEFTGTTYYNTVSVSGTLSPDASGTYTASGWYNGRPYYRRAADNWYIWWQTATNWRLSSGVGVNTGARWGGDANLASAYVPLDIATGTATVANNTGSGTFAIVPTGWTGIVANLSTVSGGVSGNALQVENSQASNGSASQAITTIVGAVYKLRAWYKNGTTTGFYAVSTVAGGSDIVAGTQVNSAGGTFAEATFTATTTTTYIRFGVFAGVAGATALFDTIELIQLPSNADSWTESVAGTSRIRREDTDVYSGSNALAMDVDASGSNVGLSLNVLTANKLYTTVLNSKVSDITGSPMARVSYGSSQVAYTPTVSFATYTLTGRAAGSTFAIERHTNAGSKSILVDSVTLTAAEIQATQGIARSQTRDANFAVQLNGTNQYLSATTTAFNPGTGDFTLGCAFYLDALPASGANFTLVETRTDANNGWGLGIDSNGSIVFRFGDGVIVADTLAAGLKAGNWYTLIFKANRDGNGTVYINGVALTPVNISARSSSIATGLFYIGRFTYSAAAFFPGRIDNLFMVTRLTTDAEDTWLYNGGKWRQWAELGVAGTDGANLTSAVIPGFFEFDDAANLGYNSAGSVHLTPTGTPTQGNGINYAAGNVARIESRYGSVVATQSALSKRPYLVANVQNGKPGLYFKGVDDLLTMSNFSSATEGTVYIVCKPLSITAVQNLLTSCDEATTSHVWGVRLSNDKVGVVHRANGDTYDSVVGDTALSIGSTYVITVRSNGSAYSLRVNGIAQTLTVQTGVNAGDWWGDTPERDSFVLGALKSNGESQFFNGYIFEVLPYDRYHVDALVGPQEQALASKWSVSL